VATAAGTSFTGGAANHVEPFSSDGPRRVFFLANGTAITPGNLSSTGGALRQKPDVAAADGVATATPGFDPFFGTSAAAPHAAAIAALMLDKNPTLTPAQVRSIFNATALDIEAAGADRDSGVGIVMADSAVAGTPELVPLIFTDGFESGNTFAWSLTVP
jgi:subtilisin family serine protease